MAAASQTMALSLESSLLATPPVSTPYKAAGISLVLAAIGVLSFALRKAINLRWVAAAFLLLLVWAAVVLLLPPTVATPSIFP